jgi:hypothetical protein
MNRPDSNSPDQSANRDDDAVWLDLVSRLQATSSDTRQESTGRQSPSPQSPGSQPPPSPQPPGSQPPTPQSPAAVPPEPDKGTKSLFGDFDPLGLAGSAPVEKSARERGEDLEAGHRQDGSPDGPRDYEVEDDGGFVPDEPPSLAGAEPMMVLAWLGAVGGPISLLLAVMFWRTAPLMVILGIVAIFVASVVYLIMRLPQEKDENDDGARV